MAAKSDDPGRGPAGPADRDAFAERLCLQVRARYPGTQVEVDERDFLLRVVAEGTATVLPLTPLYHSCQRAPDKTGTLISAFVAAVEKQISSDQLTVPLGPLMWCVRTRPYLDDMRRAQELCIQEVAGDLVAFVAETLPGSFMKGVPTQRWQALGLDEAEVKAKADDNTTARFASLPGRIRATPRLAADGWRFSADSLFQGSMILLPEVLTALTERADGEVLIGLPDRGWVLAIPAQLPNANGFALRLTREWREAMNPCSPTVLLTDGKTLRALPKRASSSVLPWLSD